MQLSKLFLSEIGEGMDTLEHKFVLKLLDFDNYRTSLSKIQLNNQTKASQREKTCRQLCDRGLVECSNEVIKLKITPAGKALLKLAPATLPVSEQELKVLRASEKEKITPGKTNIPAGGRQAVIQSLKERGLIEVETKIKEVWLSARGQEFLQNEYNPKGSASITLDMLNNYCRFFRKSLQNAVSPSVKNGRNGISSQTSVSESQPSDEEILQLIHSLDRQLATENYLPIFHLRQKLESQLSREELDRALYRLQKGDRIELSALVEANRYSSEQVNAGILQSAGSPLFFIQLN